MFLLHVTDILLAPPLVMDHLGPGSYIDELVILRSVLNLGNKADNLCSDLIKSLFETWLIACSKCFPTPTFWKTLSQFVQRWLHHMHVLDWWARFTLILGDRVIQLTQGPGYPRITPVEAEDEALVVPLTEDIATESWISFSSTYRKSSPTY